LVEQKGFEPVRKPRKLGFSHRNVSRSASFGAVCPTWGKTAGKLIVLNPDLPITNKPEAPSSINDCEESSTKSKNSAG
jgi:hypothetical protein